MQHFNFYQQRNFGNYISDSIGFLKYYFKDFTKNFIIINAAMILFLTLIIGFIIVNPNDIKTIAGGIIVLSVVSCPFIFMIWLFPITYGIYAEKHPKRLHFSPEEIFKNMLKITGRSLLFCIGMGFVLLGIFSLASVLIAPLLTTGSTIGYLAVLLFSMAFFILIPTLFQQSLLVYLAERTSLVQALKRGWQICSEKTLHKLGAFLVMQLVVGTVTYLIIGIIMLIGIVMESFGISVHSLMDVDFFGLILGGILLIVSTLVVFYSASLQTILQLIFYYSSKEEKHLLSSIEQIGEPRQ